MPGRDGRGRAAAARGAEAAGHHHDPDAARREPHASWTRPSEVTQHYLDVLDKVAAAGLDAQISVKPTQLGLDLDRAMCERNLDRLLERAEQRGNFLWIDMENSPLRRSDAEAVPPRAGEVRRASASRSRPTSIAPRRTSRSLIPLGPAIRIVKGAYLEPPDVAYPKKSRRRRELLHAVRAADVSRTRSAPARCCTSRRTTSPLADRLRRVHRASTRCRRPPTSSRCSTASSASQQQRLAAERQAAARAHQLRRVLVPVVHAPPGRAPGQRVVRAEEMFG